MAGLLTYSLPGAFPLHLNFLQQWQDSLKVLELTAAGTVQDFSDNYRNHLIPFSAFLLLEELSTILCASIDEKFDFKKYKFSASHKIPKN